MSKPTKPTTLLDSAVEFLVEAFLTYNAKKPRLAMVHAVTAAELVLKERLARIHPNLIFKNLDAQNITQEQTVSLRHLPRRLLNVGIKIDQKETELIHQCANWRNQIVHHRPDFDPNDVKVQFPKMVDFIAAFMRRELGTGIEKVLPKTWYRTAKKILKDWQHALAEAQTQATRAGNVLGEACRECGGEGVLCVRDSTQVYCHLCGSDDYVYHECARCGRKTINRFDPSTEQYSCMKCIEKIAEELAANRGAPWK
jgi:Primosomal protein N'' (replication factor Y) - superfamily II helicase